LNVTGQREVLNTFHISVNKSAEGHRNGAHCRTDTLNTTKQCCNVVTSPNPSYWGGGYWDPDLGFETGHLDWDT